MTDEAWIGTVRIARDLGNVSALLPRHVRSLLDLPYRLYDAILRALTVLSWQDNLDEHEQPPRHIWLDNKKLVEHMNAVRAARKRAVGGGHDIEDPVENAAAKSLISG